MCGDEAVWVLNSRTSLPRLPFCRKGSREPLREADLDLKWVSHGLWGGQCGPDPFLPHSPSASQLHHSMEAYFDLIVLPEKAQFSAQMDAASSSQSVSYLHVCKTLWGKSGAPEVTLAALELWGSRCGKVGAYLWVKEEGASHESVQPSYVRCEVKQFVKGSHEHWQMRMPVVKDGSIKLRGKLICSKQFSLSKLQHLGYLLVFH